MCGVVMNRKIARVFQICFLSVSCFAQSEDYDPNAGCLEECHIPEGEVLFITDTAHMCPKSDLYGRELSRPFVSRIWAIGSDDEAKTWQLRTLTVFDANDRPHHLLFPFIINSGGLTPYVGAQTVSVLKKYGAKEREDHSKGFATYCRLKVPLPIKSTKCVIQWAPGKYDDGKDIRNNMVGAQHARVIIAINGFVDYVLKGRGTRESVLQTLFEEYPSGKMEDFEQEFDLQFAAPISKSFIPPESMIPLLETLEEL